jgi:hypothetical protein
LLSRQLNIEQNIRKSVNLAKQFHVSKSLKNLYERIILNAIALSLGFVFLVCKLKMFRGILIIFIRAIIKNGYSISPVAIPKINV